jgi:hypothetical protein
MLCMYEQSLTFFGLGIFVSVCDAFFLARRLFGIGVLDEFQYENGNKPLQLLSITVSVSCVAELVLTRP